jgi:hypothetical protein
MIGGGSFGLFELPSDYEDSDSDDDGGPTRAYLLSQRFGLVDQLTDKRYVVELDIKKRTGAVAKGNGKAAIILEAPLGSKEPLRGLLVGVSSGRDATLGIFVNYGVSLCVNAVVVPEPPPVQACATLLSGPHDQKRVIS